MSFEACCLLQQYNINTLTISQTIKPSSVALLTLCLDTNRTSVFACIVEFQIVSVHPFPDFEKAVLNTMHNMVQIPRVCFHCDERFLYHQHTSGMVDKRALYLTLDKLKRATGTEQSPEVLRVTTHLFTWYLVTILKIIYLNNT